MKNKYLIPLSVLIQYLVWAFITMDFKLVDTNNRATFVFFTVIITVFASLINDSHNDNIHIDKEQ